MSAPILDNKRHIFFIWQVYFFALPQRVVNRESVYSYCQMFGVYLRKTFASWIISARSNIFEKVLIFEDLWIIWYLLEKFVEHFIVNQFGSSAVQLWHYFGVWAIRVERSELTTGVPEQNQKVFAFWSVDFF